MARFRHHHPRPSLARAASLLALVATAAGIPATGCTRPPPPPEPAPPTAEPTPALDTVQAQVRDDCLVPYAECPITIGLPALSADGSLVAVADRGPDSPRDERPLTIRVIEIATADDVERHPIITLADYDDAGYDSMNGRFSAERQATLAARVAGINELFTAGGYRAIPTLGRVHEDHPGELAAGLRASFDGDALEVFDAEIDQIRWRREIEPSPAWSPTPGIECGPFPVAEIAVWAARRPSVIVAHVSYIGADLCATVYPYLVWR